MRDVLRIITTRAKHRLVTTGRPLRTYSDRRRRQLELTVGAMVGTGNEVYRDHSNQFVPFPSRRSVVHSTKGIVASTQPLACRAGITVLEQGGNAVDAAVATAAALNMTEPGSTGIGGDMFCLFYDAQSKRTRALNGSGRSGAGMTLERIRKDLGLQGKKSDCIPFRSVHSVTVPGAAAGWVDAVEKFGSGKLSMEQILQPAIELGEEGFPVSTLSAAAWQQAEAYLKQASPSYGEILKADKQAKDGCRAPRQGELFRNANLANTFRLVATHGKKGFYEGEVAKALIKVVQDLGGRLTLDDLKHHAEVGSEEVDAISLKFSGQKIEEPVELWEHPPNGQGLVALIALGIFEQLEKAGKIPAFSANEHNSPAYLHAVIEALRLAFSDGTWNIADPATNPVPVDALLSPKYLAKRGENFSASEAIPKIAPGSPALQSSDTVYLSVTDPHGNACSFINSNYGGFGTGIVPKGCGFTLQNRGANFTLGPPDDHANILAPRKRPFHTIIPAMVTRPNDGGSLHTCFGVMGGFMQPQGHMQVLLNMLVFGMDPQSALDAPRICIQEVGSDGVSEAKEDEVYLEEGIPESTVSALKRLGHNAFSVKSWNRAVFGRGQVIRKSEEDGQLIWSAGSDLRGDGHASPL